MNKIKKEISKKNNPKLLKNRNLFSLFFPNKDTQLKIYKSQTEPYIEKINKEKNPNNKKLKNKKKIVTLAITSSVVGVIATAAVLYPTIKAKIQTNSIDRRPISTTTVQDLFPNTKVEVDENNKIIEFPDTQQDMQQSFNFFNDKIISDLGYFKYESKEISEILFVSQYSLSTEKYNKGCMIDLAVKNLDGEIFLLEYYSPDKKEIPTGINSSDNLICLISFLENECCLSYAKIKKENEILNQTGAIINGSPFNYTENSGDKIIKTRLYFEDKIEEYSIENYHLLELGINKNEIINYYLNNDDNNNIEINNLVEDNYSKQIKSDYSKCFNLLSKKELNK